MVSGLAQKVLRFKRATRVLLALGFLMSITLVLLDRFYPIPVPDEGDGVVVVASDGTPLRAFPAADGVWRYRITPDDVSPHYLDALIGYEDQYFFHHVGVNPLSLVRGLWQWVSNGRIVSGGSTLTMQVARILDGPAERTVSAKVRQILRALQLEAHLSKREILTLYLNHAPMGGIVEGVEMASRTYLGKSAKSLTRAEAAMLAALPQSPTRLRPDTQAARAQAARDKILDRMVTLHRWSAELAADAKIERVIAQPLRNVSAGWVAPLAAQRLKSAYKASDAVRLDAHSDARSGNPDKGANGVIHSTIDIELQARIEAMLQDRVRSLPPKVSMAAIVMENDTLAIRAYVGSADFSDDERAAHVDMTRAVRSPGSALKPFLYGLALDDGLIHSESLMVDAPQSFGGYAPGNFQAAFSGAVSVSEALQRSLNVPAVDLLERYGSARFASSLRAGGLKLRMDQGAAPNLSLILGGGGTTLEELVGAYRAFAAGGMAGKPRLTSDTPILEARLMSEGAAWIIRDILEAGGRPERPFDEGGSRAALAWKTGTSFGFRDAWAIGVTDRYTLGIWIGRPDGTPNPGFFGANSAAPLAKDIAAILPLALLQRTPQPASVAPQAICWPLGLRADSTPQALCHTTRQAWTLNQSAPPTLPDRARSGSLREVVLVESMSGKRVSPLCQTTPGVQTEELEIARWPAHLEAWLTADILSKARPPDWRAGCSAASAGAQSAQGLVIRGIENGSVIRTAAMHTSQQNDKQRSKHSDRTSIASVPVSIIGAAQGSNIYWLLNGQILATQPASKALIVNLAQEGRYALTAVDERGRYARVEFSAPRPFDKARALVQ